MVNKYRYKCPKDKLDEHHIHFCILYAESRDSLAAYNESHKHINKVKASTLLQSIAIWNRIFEYYQSKENPSHYERFILSEYDLVVSKTTLNPFTIFFSYANIEFSKKSNHKTEDTNPVLVLKKLFYSLRFFNYLDRDYFKSKICTAIKRELQYYEMLSARNPVWISEYANLVKELKKDGINPKIYLNDGQ